MSERKNSIIFEILILTVSKLGEAKLAVACDCIMHVTIIPTQYLKVDDDDESFDQLKDAIHYFQSLFVSFFSVHLFFVDG